MYHTEGKTQKIEILVDQRPDNTKFEKSVIIKSYEMKNYKIKNHNNMDKTINISIFDYRK